MKMSSPPLRGFSWAAAGPNRLRMTERTTDASIIDADLMSTSGAGSKVPVRYHAPHGAPRRSAGGGLPATASGLPSMEPPGERSRHMPIATPEVYAEMLDRAKAGAFAYPAINVSSSQTLNAALKGFADAASDGIVQVSTGGASYLSGAKVNDMVVGATALAEYAHVVAARYPVHIALHTDHCPKNNLDKYVRPLIKLSQERVARGQTPLFQSHMWDGSAVSLAENLEIARELLDACRKAKIVLEV